jgi:hypothetical protein
MMIHPCIFAAHGNFRPRAQADGCFADRSGLLLLRGERPITCSHMRDLALLQ